MIDIDELAGEIASVTKFCPGCQTAKLLSAYQINRCRPDGRQSYCRECVNAEMRDYQRLNAVANRERATAWSKAHPEAKRKRYLKKHYGVTPADYDAVFDQQDGRCGRCSAEAVEGRNLCIRQQVRGEIDILVCWTCRAYLSQRPKG